MPISSSCVYLQSDAFCRSHFQLLELSEQKISELLGVMKSQVLGGADAEVSLWDGLGSSHFMKSQCQRGNGQLQEELTLVYAGTLWPICTL